MNPNSALSWRSGWPPFTFAAIGLGIALFAAGMHFRQVLLCTVGGALAAAGIVSLRRRRRAGELHLTENGIESADGQRIAFTDITRISNALGVRCPVSRDTDSRDCWIEGADGTHLHVPVRAAPDRRAWISSLSRWLEPAAPELPESLKAAWTEESSRYGASALRGAWVVPASVVQSRGGPPVSIEVLGAAAGGALAAVIAKLTDCEGSLGISLTVMAVVALAGGAGLLLRRMRLNSPARSPGGIIISPGGLRVLFRGKTISVTWSEVREASARGASLHLQASGQSVVLPPVFSDSAAEMERFIRQHLR
jgi:hypothetical protein